MMKVTRSYPLLLTGDKRLKSGRHSEAKLVYERGLVLAVDLDLDPGFKRRLVCTESNTVVCFVVTRFKTQVRSG